jgi:sporulation protein YlmC with PRC-barrel domain
MSTRSDTARDLEGRTVYSSDGEKIGKVDDLHGDETGMARYIEVKTGWFGTKRHAVPVDSLSFDGDDIVVPYTKSQIEAAPTLNEEDHLDYDRERQMGSHYGYEVREWDDRRDAWLDRDLTKGPTPETRGDFHDPGGTLDQSDGPTPETRRAMAETDDMGTARSDDMDRDRMIDDRRDSAMRVRYQRMSLHQ